MASRKGKKAIAIVDKNKMFIQPQIDISANIPWIFIKQGS
jgi:hypothetical protein